jgi:hypothetical protein
MSTCCCPFNFSLEKHCTITVLHNSYPGEFGLDKRRTGNYCPYCILKIWTYFVVQYMSSCHSEDVALDIAPYIEYIGMVAILVFVILV